MELRVFVAKTIGDAFVDDVRIILAKSEDDAHGILEQKLGKDVQAGTYGAKEANECTWEMKELPLKEGVIWSSGIQIWSETP